MDEQIQPDANHPDSQESEASAASTEKNKGGRPKGAKNKRTLERAARLKRLSERLKSECAEAFTGTAHELLVAVYQNPEWPIDIRLDAAKSAVKFEKPALAATELTGKNGSALNPATPPQFIIEFTDLLDSEEPAGDA